VAMKGKWPGTVSNCRHEDFQSCDGGGTMSIGLQLNEAKRLLIFPIRNNSNKWIWQS
jgi:hypothetical protein